MKLARTEEEPGGAGVFSTASCIPILSFTLRVSKAVAQREMVLIFRKHTCAGRETEEREGMKDEVEERRSWNGKERTEGRRMRTLFKPAVKRLLSKTDIAASP